ncbi:Helicase associated domain protein (plasmid) [Streptomyces sp. NBC_00513]|uniref:DEAD/DEAH box helicase n=1 Tax=unclassified Streptomyces TaxID=2593676 RepID=UPI00225B0A8C|nr:DEAD/DEAH box helicase [Streptomyces sp. NBC_00424]MCX5078756.1 Helicase associated domain protein [Streptomyces sp. NBC_00424]WUD46322.1 Helicase associated domain protein [Streptomyces sp. NBC_00513]
MTVELRPYQNEAITAIFEGLAGGGVGQLHAACGSGKSLMAQQSAMRLLPAGGLAVVMVPSLALVAQTITTWRALHPAGTGLDVLAVCSDDTVTDAPAHLPDIPAQVTTDPQIIADWLARPARGGIRLIVGTYISANRLHDALHQVEAKLDLLVLDEAHHLTGRPDFVIRRVTEPTYLPAVRRLYMTATPRVDAAAAGRHGHLSMDDVALFGPVLYTYPFSRGIAEGYLEDYRLYVIGIRESEARAMLADKGREYVEGPGAPSMQTLVAQAALVRAAQKYGVRRAVSFHARVAQAAEFSRSLPDLSRRLAPSLPAPLSRVIHGEMSPRLREQVLDDLRLPPADGWTVVANSRLLGEGVDVPALDTVLFAHPKSSAVDIVQGVGRTLRPHPDTPGLSTIIVPLIVPEQDGEIGDLDPGDYATLWQVVRALRAHDEPLGSALDNCRSKSTISNPSLPSKITVELPGGTGQALIEQVELLLVRQSTSPWWEGFGAAHAYHEEHGHLDIPSGHVTADGRRLGQWINNARQHRRKGWMGADRIAALDRLGMIWDSDWYHFQTAFGHARTYRETHGHLNVPQAYRTPDGYRLGTRINMLRRDYANGRLTPERITALERLDMTWNTRAQANEELIAQARAFHAAHGHLRVPHTHVTDDGYPLGSALKTRRNRYPHGDVDSGVVSALDELGMVWDLREARFADGLAACRRYRDQHGDLAVPVNHIDAEGYNLGDFIAYQRSVVAGSTRDASGRARTLDPERRAALDELGMIWSATTPKRPPTDEEIAALRAFPHQRGKPFAEALLALVEAGVEQKALAEALDVRTSTLSLRIKRARANIYAADPFPQHLDAARAFHEQHGHLRPQETSDDAGTRSLADWLTKQRAARRNGQLTDKQIAALNELGMDWDPLGSRWQQALQAARSYHGEHGHLRPSTGTTVNGLDLTVWLTRQRTAHQRGTLPPERAAALDELGIDWTPGRGVADVRIDQAWQTRLDDARQYQAAHGHLRPPARTTFNGKRLDAWLSVQRARNREGRLTPQQIAALDELGIHW